MFAVQKWNFLEPTGIYFSSHEHGVIHKTHTRVDIRIWKSLEEMRDDEFSSSEIDEPVGDDGDALVLKIHFPNSIVFS